jgi:hypothetical protein
LAHQYYLIFLILSLLCILYKAQTVKNQYVLKLVVGILAIVQLFTGFIFLQNSSIGGERSFIAVLFNRAADTRQDQNRGLANYLSRLPEGSHVLVDDAVAYPVVAFTNNIQRLTLPYQSVFLSAIEAPDKYDDYILLATEKNEVTGFTQLNNKYIPVAKKANSALKLRRVYETDDWTLFKIAND